MGQREFKQSLIEVIEFLIDNDLPESSIQLISYYFNHSKAKTVQLKAQETIEKYLKDNIFSKPISEQKLKDRIEKMVIEAKYWEQQIAIAMKQAKNKSYKIQI